MFEELPVTNTRQTAVDEYKLINRNWQYNVIVSRAIEVDCTGRAHQQEGMAFYDVERIRAP